MKLFKIEITGEIPAGEDDLDAEAKVTTRDPAAAIIKTLEAMGLKNCTQRRWTLRPKKKAAA